VFFVVVLAFPEEINIYIVLQPIRPIRDMSAVIFTSLLESHYSETVNPVLLDPQNETPGLIRYPFNKSILSLIVFLFVLFEPECLSRTLEASAGLSSSFKRYVYGTAQRMRSSSQNSTLCEASNS
jgi:hypothetical protein